MKESIPLSKPVICVTILSPLFFSTRTKMKLSRKVHLLSRSFTCRQRGRTAGAMKPLRLKRKMRMKGVDKEFLCQSVSENNNNNELHLHSERGNSPQPSPMCSTHLGDTWQPFCARILPTHQLELEKKRHRGTYTRWPDVDCQVWEFCQNTGEATQLFAIRVHSDRICRCGESLQTG